MRVVEEARPRVVALENVDGLAYRNAGAGLRFVLDRLAAVNRKFGTRYRAVHSCVAGESFGVLQRRKRRVLVLAEMGRSPGFLAPLTEPLRTTESPSGDSNPLGNAHRVPVHIPFPDTDASPPLRTERPTVSLITCHVGLDLGDPIGSVVALTKIFEAALEVATMPKVSIAENRHLFRPEDDIGVAREACSVN